MRCSLAIELVQRDSPCVMRRPHGRRWCARGQGDDVPQPALRSTQAVSPTACSDSCCCSNFLLLARGVVRPTRTGVSRLPAPPSVVEMSRHARAELVGRAIGREHEPRLGRQSRRSHVLEAGLTLRFFRARDDVERWPARDVTDAEISYPARRSTGSGYVRRRVFAELVKGPISSRAPFRRGASWCRSANAQAEQFGALTCSAGVRRDASGVAMRSA